MFHPIFKHMVKRFIFTFLVLMGLMDAIYSQSESDVLRFAQTSPVGTARSLALGGAFSAAGADLSSAYLNPAGLALYRSSEFVVSPAFKLVNSDASYLGNSRNTSAQTLTLSNWGLAFYNPLYYDTGSAYEPATKGLVSYTFAFGQNQIDNYRREISVSGYNELSSITDMFVEWADGIFVEDLASSTSLAGMAFNTFLIDTLRGETNRYFPAVNNGRVQQSARIIDEGRNNEWFLSLAGNVDDFIYVGLTVGIQSIRYERQFLYREEDINNLHEFYQNLEDNPAGFPLETPFNSLEFADNFTTRGLGINGRLGIIVRPSDFIRLGISAQSPTYFSLTDEFSSRMKHNLTFVTGATELEETSEPGQFEYNMTTPFRITFGGMYLLGKKGFITADVEYTDYTSSKLSNKNTDINSIGFDDFEDANANIQELFKSALNIRLGAEARIDIFRIRAGGALYGRALTDEALEYLDYPDASLMSLNNPDRRVLSFGLGLRQPNYSLDVTFVNQQQNEKLNPYNTASPNVFVPTIVNNKTVNSVVMSVGFKF